MGSSSSRDHHHIQEDTKSGKYLQNFESVSLESNRKVTVDVNTDYESVNAGDKCHITIPNRKIEFENISSGNVETNCKSVNAEDKNHASVRNRNIEFENISSGFKPRSYSFPQQKDRISKRNSPWLLAINQNNEKRISELLEHSRKLKTVGYKAKNSSSVAKRRECFKNSNTGYTKEGMHQPSELYTSDTLYEEQLFKTICRMYNTEDTREFNLMNETENIRNANDIEGIRKSKWHEDLAESESKEEVVESFIPATRPCCIEKSKWEASEFDLDIILNRTNFLGKPCSNHIISAVNKRTNIDKAWLSTIQQTGSISGIIHLNRKRAYFRNNLNQLKREARFSSKGDSMS